MINLFLFLSLIMNYIAYAIHFICLWVDGASADSFVLVETFVASLLCDIVSFVCIRKCWGTKKSRFCLVLLLVVDFCFVFMVVGNMRIYRDIFGW